MGVLHILQAIQAIFGFQHKTVLLFFSKQPNLLWLIQDLKMLKQQKEKNIMAASHFHTNTFQLVTTAKHGERNLGSWEITGVLVTKVQCMIACTGQGSADIHLMILDNLKMAKHGLLLSQRNKSNRCW